MKIILTVSFVFLFSFCAVAQSATVTSDKAVSRGTHDPKGKTVETLTKGAKVEVVKTFGDWLLIQSADYTGWIMSYEIKLDEPPVSTPPIVSLAPEKPSAETAPAAPDAPRSSGSAMAMPKKAADGRTYLTGKRGGCYYLNGSGNKVYVDKALCGN